MRMEIQKSLLQHVIGRRNGYLAIACGSLLLNMLLSVGVILMVGREKIVLVPPKIEQTFWVGHNSVSQEYLSEMSHFFATLRFNIKPNAIGGQREVLLRYVSPEYYESLKVELVNEVARMTKEHITTAFFPVEIKTDVKHLEALITGDLITTIGANQLPVRRVTYKISYGNNNYRLLVKKLIEVKLHA
jgi:conjugal transfer pilus assembly protein TraE